MPSTPAQLKAAKKWRDTHRELNIKQATEWQKNNIDKQRAYARRSMAKNYLWKCAVRDLNRCLCES